MAQLIKPNALHTLHTLFSLSPHSDHNHTMHHHTLQGATEQQLQLLQTPESFADFAQRCRPDVETLVKLSIIFQDIVEKVNAKAAAARAAGGGEDGSDTTNGSGGSGTEEINFTTAEGATVTGTITSSDGDGTDTTSDTTSPAPMPLEITPEEVHAQLDKVEIETTIRGEKPVDRDMVM